jgi:hypothetical protein
LAHFSGLIFGDVTRQAEVEYDLALEEQDQLAYEREHREAERERERERRMRQMRHGIVGQREGAVPLVVVDGHVVNGAVSRRLASPGRRGSPGRVRVHTSLSDIRR